MTLVLVVQMYHKLTAKWLLVNLPYSFFMEDIMQKE